ncbi:MAG: DUF4810 domain-containing protein [Bacteroidaceae bacterium]
MKKLYYIGALAALTLTLTSCHTTQSLYSWYDYEDATYKYSKRTTDELQVKVLEQYQKITEKQKGVRGVVPPGMYAEYGYLLFKTGKKEEGLSFLNKEIELYPESKTYISRIIKQLEK